ncbi:MAG TPA: hypothetical protein VN258_12810 [Mobilitalea sp.]|nr:hypothetical protein [Mobilitalea sp.]
MNLLNKLERRFGRFAIPNLMRYVVGLLMLGLIIGSFMPGVYYQYLSLDFSMIAKGQVWRLITFIIPLDSFRNILFFAISTYFYYLIGNTLEQHWGAFRLNLYFFAGVIFNILGSLIMYLVFHINLSLYTSSAMGYICSSLFFAFAALYPNMTFYVYFLIPIKAKYLAWLEGAIYLYDIYNNIVSGQAFMVLPMVMALANFIIFFFATRNYRRISPSEIKRKANYRRQMNEGKNTGNVTQFKGRNVITRHKCAVCGRTELDGDNLEFRFCSKCDGNYEYCMDHLFTHEHVKNQ